MCFIYRHRSSYIFVLLVCSICRIECALITGIGTRCNASSSTNTFEVTGGVFVFSCTINEDYTSDNITWKISEDERKEIILTQLDDRTQQNSPFIIDTFYYNTPSFITTKFTYRVSLCDDYVLENSPVTYDAELKRVASGQSIFDVVEMNYQPKIKLPQCIISMKIGKRWKEMDLDLQISRMVYHRIKVCVIGAEEEPAFKFKLEGSENQVETAITSDIDTCLKKSCTEATMFFASDTNDNFIFFTNATWGNNNFEEFEFQVNLLEGACTPDYCGTDGQCQILDGYSVCSCPPGFNGHSCRGTMCDIECANKGVCVPLEGNHEKSYQCFCTPDFGGDLCDEKIGCFENGGCWITLAFFIFLSITAEISYFYLRFKGLLSQTAYFSEKEILYKRPKTLGFRIRFFF